ncbi:helix-turn-helix domain-containing protein (plasmid) [Streptomyces virginiae]|uniref:helix-turn-helix domain-containing protein n=1 Tax=Streptomyces virginiae TaxID=1961 RepID=UPI002F90AB81
MATPGQSAASLYAAALREGLTAFFTAGGLQKDIAQALNMAPSTLSRYLKGERVASREILASLRDYLAQQGMPWTPEEYENLDALCGQAHAASGSPAVQLAQLNEELARLRAEQEKAQQVAEERLKGLEEQAGRLAEQLEEALERAKTAENRVAEQDEALRHAQEYTHGMAAELDQQREQARKLQQEVEVLRKQNRRLIEEQPRVPGVSTQDTSLEATLAARRTRQARIAQEEARIARERSESARKLRESYGPYPPRTPAPHRTPPTRAAASGLRYTPVRDTLVILVLAAVLFVLGIGFSGGLQASPGPSVWKLVLAGVIGLLISAGCWAQILQRADKYGWLLADKYGENSWVPAVVDVSGLVSAPSVLAGSIIASFIVGTGGGPGHWLADIMGLL